MGNCEKMWNVSISLAGRWNLALALDLIRAFQRRAVSRLSIYVMNGGSGYQPQRFALLNSAVFFSIEQKKMGGKRLEINLCE